MTVYVNRIDATITIDDVLFQEAKDHFILTDNHDFIEVYIMNAIRSQVCQNRKDFQQFSFEKTKKKYSEEEFSKIL